MAERPKGFAPENQKSNGLKEKHSPKPATPAPLGRAWHRLALFTLAVAASSVGYYWSSGHAQAPALPDAYALCARGEYIYTVDTKNPRVECIGVRSGEVFATGHLSEFGAPS